MKEMNGMKAIKRQFKVKGTKGKKNTSVLYSDDVNCPWTENDGSLWGLQDSWALNETEGGKMTGRVCK